MSHFSEMAALKAELSNRGFAKTTSNLVLLNLTSGKTDVAQIVVGSGSDFSTFLRVYDGSLSFFLSKLPSDVRLSRALRTLMFRYFRRNVLKGTKWTSIGHIEFDDRNDTGDKLAIVTDLTVIGTSCPKASILFADKNLIVNKKDSAC